MSKSHTSPNILTTLRSRIIGRSNGRTGAAEPAAPASWPTTTWPTSTPEKQGMDSAKLVEMVRFYEKVRSENEKILIDSITVVRRGRIVADIYRNPIFPRETNHVIHSCTKSIMSALVGIALGEGYIEDVRVPVLDIFSRKEGGQP